MSAQASIEWFENQAAYEERVLPDREARRRAERELAQRSSSSGFCVYCGEATEFQVASGLFFGDAPNLRDGLICPSCKLSNRMRLLYLATTEWLERLDRRRPRVYLAETVTVFRRRVAERVSRLETSEYAGHGLNSGEVVRRNGRRIVHQDLRHTSYKSGRFDLAIHGDVLEHVAGYDEALAELCRILAPGAATVFTVPFLEEIEGPEVRAELSPEGEVVHLMEPEVHGNPVDEAGSLVFQAFGWRLLEDLREAGFNRAWIGFLSDPELGFTSNNSPAGNFMEPLVFAASRPGRG